MPMKQLTQKLKSGQMQILEAPCPMLSRGHILIKNHYSLISPGTEGSTVRAARANIIEKAKERPQQVQQVFYTLKMQGPVQTYRTVMKKLDAYSPLGYSCAGEVIEIAPDVTTFSVGDFVACGGNSASHAEVASVPINLCTKLPTDVNLRDASYNTLGAIALQGIRQADLRLGETCAVIGLGLLGHLTCLLLKASGIRVIGIDINPVMVEMAKHCADLTLLREQSEITPQIEQFTGGIGCDAVIITAASDSLDPINFAGAICRKRGTVVIVGSVPTGFDREPDYYRKELQIKMSCSYGPGRYDPIYEEKGIDYPPGYVRWTENRNMAAFQEMVNSGKIDLSYLTTHVFKLEDAPKAYDLILKKEEPYLGILIEYDASKPVSRDRIPINPRSNNRNVSSTISIGFIGGGSYAQSYLLPNIPKDQNIALKGVLTATPAGSRSVGDRFGFEFCTGSEDDILKHQDINTLFIATRHDSHFHYVKKGLESGKHIFVEKPLCLTLEELTEIKELYTSLIVSRPLSPMLMVGYNRRFSPLALMLKDRILQAPLAMTYRVNAGPVPADSWIQDVEVGGGRIIGEVCHFIDFMVFLTGSFPKYVYAVSMTDPNHLNDTVNINLEFENGSIGTMSYFSNGAKSVPKENIEVYHAGMTAIIHDFKSLEIHGGKKPFKKRLLSQNKGQKNMIKEFLRAVKDGLSSPIPFNEVYAVSLATFKAVESIRTRRSLEIS